MIRMLPSFPALGCALGLALVLAAPLAAQDEPVRPDLTPVDPPTERDLAQAEQSLERLGAVIGRLLERSLEGLEEGGEELAEGAQALGDRLEALIAELPTYELPEVLPNGDIIIRRRPDGAAPPQRALEYRERDNPIDM